MVDKNSVNFMFVLWLEMRLIQLIKQDLGVSVNL